MTDRITSVPAINSSSWLQHLRLSATQTSTIHSASLTAQPDLSADISTDLTRKYSLRWHSSK